MAMRSEMAELFHKLSAGKVVLFVGAGASIDAGGPTTEDLVNRIKKTFPGAIFKGDDLTQTCTDVTETTLTARKDLENVVQKALYDLKPSLLHCQIPLYTWPAIFTTNYDDLIEKGYQSVENRVQLPDPVFSDKDPLVLNDMEKVKIFRLMGSISATHPDGRMVLTREDYNVVLKNRPAVFKVLHDLIRDGTVLFIGYSFGDNLLLDILSELQRTIGLNCLPYNYALMPDTQAGSIQYTKLAERKVIPLKMTAKQFAELLVGGTPLKLTPIKDKEDIRVVVKGQHKAISHRDSRLYSENFQFLSEDVVLNVAPDEEEVRRDFFRGLLHDWTGYAREWDFRREEYGIILVRISRELENLNVGENKSLLLQGPAGCGKTVMVHRIAYDVYRKLGNPVILLRPYYEDIDLKLLATLCEELSYLEGDRRRKGAAARAKVLILMESASSHIADFRIIPIFMKSRGIPVLLLGSARENDWQISSQKMSESVSDEDQFTLTDAFSNENERCAFAHHLIRLGIIEGGLSDLDISRIIETDYQNSFFASIYSLVEPARPTLESKIEDEFKNLSDLARRAYLYVASFYQYDLPLPIELLVRSLGCQYEPLLEEIFHTETKNVICEVPSPLEGLYFGTRNRIIAEKVIAKQIRGMDDLVELLGHLLRNINCINAPEMKICRALLIRYIGPNGIERRLSHAQTREIFRIAVEDGKFEDAAVLHHFALFESDRGEQDRALDLAERALRQAERTHQLPFLRSERAENIYNTMGLIYSRKGQELEAAGNGVQAERHFSVAADYYSKAKSGEIQTPHPYDSECRMFIRRAEQSHDAKQKVALYVKAADVVAEAQENLPDEALPTFLELRQRIQKGLREIDQITTLISEMKNDVRFQVEGVLARVSIDITQTEASRKVLEEAYESLRGLIKVGKSDIAVLRVYANLHEALFPTEVEELFSIMQKRYAIPKEKRNLSLLYKLGKLAFALGFYDKSQEYFRTLERVSQGHPKRWNIQDIGTDKSGRKREFTGTIVRIESQNMGHVQVLELQRRVPFLPYAQKYQPSLHENVTLRIGFNYRGWLAVDLSR